MHAIEEEVPSMLRPTQTKRRYNLLLVEVSGRRGKDAAVKVQFAWKARAYQVKVILSKPLKFEVLQVTLIGKARDSVFWSPRRVINDYHNSKRF